MVFVGFGLPVMHAAPAAADPVTCDGATANDVLRGDANQNIIDGNVGTDTCDGGGGNDTLISCP
jgi:Ca2+-binding RTX toxin-like protein